MRIFNGALALLLSCGLLTGCGAMDAARTLLGAPGGARHVALRDGVSLALPRGLCADATHSKGAEGFALIAACDRFGDGARAGAPVYATVQMGALDGAALRDNEEAYAAALLGSDLGGAVRDVDVGAGQIRLALGEEDAGPWRGFTDKGGALVLVTVRALPGLSASERQGRDMLRKILRALRDPT